METAELLWRLFVTSIVVLGPTVLFLLFWHGLMRLRDGEFVQQVLANMEEQPTGAGGADGSATVQWPVQARSNDAEAAQCQQCGTSNHAEYDYCRECARPLPDG